MFLRLSQRGAEEAGNSADGAVLDVYVPVWLESTEEQLPQVALSWKSGEHFGRSGALIPCLGHGRLRFQVPAALLQGEPLTLRVITWPSDKGEFSVLWERSYWVYVEEGVPRLLPSHVAPPRQQPPR
jgi:hypothetical protein